MGIPYSYTYLSKPDVIPDFNEKPTFDQQYGFKGPREVRVSKMTEDEMRSLQIPKDKRDYCAHLWKDYMVCRRQYAPIYGLCSPEYHAYEHCEVDDYILRMKEYEREKRLRMRAAKKQAAS